MSMDASPVSQSTIKQLRETSTLTQQLSRPARSYLSASWAKLRGDWIAMAALATLVLVAVLAFMSPWINAYVLRQNPNVIDLDAIFAATQRRSTGWGRTSWAVTSWHGSSWPGAFRCPSASRSPSSP